MRPDPRKYLWDALHAAELVQDFVRGQSFADYQSDAKLRSAEVVTEPQDRFEAGSYLALTEAMNSHEIGRGLASPRRYVRCGLARRSSEWTATGSIYRTNRPSSPTCLASTCRSFARSGATTASSWRLTRSTRCWRMPSHKHDRSLREVNLQRGQVDGQR